MNRLENFLLQMFGDNLVNELQETNNIICSSYLVSQLYKEDDVEELDFDWDEIEIKYNCSLSVNDYNDFCANWDNEPDDDYFQEDFISDDHYFDSDLWPINF